MPFPSTVTGLIEPYHGIGGPFVSSVGTVYIVTRKSDSLGIQIFKAADPAASWSGAASLNVTSGNAVRALGAYQVGDVIHIVTRDAAAANSNVIRYHAFNMLTDTFSTSNQLVKTTYTIAGTVDESMVGIVVRSAGAKIVLYEGPQVLEDINRSHVYYARHLGVGWSADIALDINGVVDWYPQEVILGSGNRVHFFFSNYSGNFYWQRCLDSANALESFPAAFDLATPHNLDLGMQRGVAYSASAGGTVVRHIYFGTASPALSEFQFTSTDTPGTAVVITSLTGAVAPLNTNIRYVASLAKDDPTVYATFVNSQSGGNLAFDNAAATGSVANANSYGLTLTATAGACLLVFVNIGSGNGTVSAVNVGATQLTRMGAVEYRSIGTTRQELWGLSAAPTGAFTISAALKDGELTSFVLAAVTYTGQRTNATPFGTVIVSSSESAFSTSITIPSGTSNGITVIGFGHEEPVLVSVGAGLTTRIITPGNYPGIIVAEAPGAGTVTGSASRVTTSSWGNIGLNLLASATSTRGVYLMSSQDAGSWSTPTLLQAATGIHVWSNCFVRNSTRVLGVVYNDNGTIKYTEYSLSAAASASQFAARLGLLGVGR